MSNCFMLDHRSRETPINWLFQFAPEKLHRFEKLGRNLLVFKNGLFYPICPSCLVRPISRGLWLDNKYSQSWFQVSPAKNMKTTGRKILPNSTFGDKNKRNKFLNKVKRENKYSFFFGFYPWYQLINLIWCFDFMLKQIKGKDRATPHPLSQKKRRAKTYYSLKIRHRYFFL